MKIHKNIFTIGVFIGCLLLLVLAARFIFYKPNLLSQFLAVYLLIVVLMVFFKKHKGYLCLRGTLIFFAICFPIMVLHPYRLEDLALAGKEIPSTPLLYCWVLVGEAILFLLIYSAQFAVSDLNKSIQKNQIKPVPE